MNWTSDKLNELEFAQSDRYNLDNYNKITKIDEASLKVPLNDEIETQKMM
jgi:hypothetical protein